MSDATTTSPFLTLHGFWRSSATFRVRVALRLKGLQFEERSISIETGEHRGAEYLAINPQGALPALTIPGHPPLIQSLAILEFLDELAPSPAILPADPFDRAWVRSLSAILCSDTHPLITPRIFGYIRENMDADTAAWRAWQTHWFHTGLAAFERCLAKDKRPGEFCLGNQVGMADICLASLFAVMDVLKIDPPADLPIASHILANTYALPAFRESYPFNQPGAPAG